MLPRVRFDEVVRAFSSSVSFALLFLFFVLPGTLANAWTRGRDARSDSRLASFLTQIRSPWSEKLVESSDVLVIPGNCFAV